MARGAGIVLSLLLFSQVLLGADGRAQLAAPGGLDEVAAVLRGAHQELKTRLEETLDRRTRTLIRSPEGFGQELRRMLFRARDAAHLDLLIAVSKRGTEPAKFILSSDGLSVRARVEEDPAARALVESIALGGLPVSSGRSGEQGAESPGSAEAFGGVPFVVLPEAFFEEIVSGPGQDEEPSQSDLFMIHVASVGGEVALIGGLRLSSLAGKIQKGLDKRWGPKAPRWSAFLCGKPARGKAPSAASAARIVAGEGQGLAVPEELIALLDKQGRVIWQEAGKERPASAGGPGSLSGEWMVLRDHGGGLAGGMGVRVPTSTIASASQADEEAREARRLAEWATAGVIGGLMSLVAWLFLVPRRRRSSSSRSRRRRKGALAQAREELSTELKSAAQKLSDPVLMGPILEKAVEHAVARAGGTLACEIGERIASTIAEIAPRESAARMAAPPAGGGPGSRGEVLSRAVLARSFPIPLLAVDGRFEVIAWNPAAERLWGAEAAERLGKSLDQLDFYGIEGEMRGRAHRVMETGVVEPPVRLSFDRESIHHIQLTVLPLHAGSPVSEPVEPSSGADAAGPPPTGALLIAENVSEKIEHEIAAKILGQYQKALSASLPLPMVVVDAEGRVMSWNAAAENLFGVPEREALGKDFASIQPPPVDQTTLPFCTPDGTQRGTLYLYGKAAQALDVPLEDSPKDEPAAAGKT